MSHTNYNLDRVETKGIHQPTRLRKRYRQKLSSKRRRRTYGMNCSRRIRKLKIKPKDGNQRQQLDQEIECPRRTQKSKRAQGSYGQAAIRSIIAMNEVEITSTIKESDIRDDNFIYTAIMMNPRQSSPIQMLSIAQKIHLSDDINIQYNMKSTTSPPPHRTMERNKPSSSQTRQHRPNISPQDRQEIGRQIKRDKELRHKGMMNQSHISVSDDTEERPMNIFDYKYPERNVQRQRKGFSITSKLTFRSLSLKPQQGNRFNVRNLYNGERSPKGSWNTRKIKYLDRQTFIPDFPICRQRCRSSHQQLSPSPYSRYRQKQSNIETSGESRTGKVSRDTNTGMHQQDIPERINNTLRPRRRDQKTINNTKFVTNMEIA